MANEQKEVVLSGGNGFTCTTVHRERVRAVCRIKNQETKELGSGFYAKVTLKGKDIYGIFTCNHVLGSETEAKKAVVTFDFEGTNPGESAFNILKPEDTFQTHEELDYTFVGLNKDDIDKLPCFVHNQIEPIMLDQETNLSQGDIICIVQHPEGRSKQLSLDRVSSVNKPYINYTADTQPGSSGSPVMTSKGMKAIAMHHTGKEGEFNKGTLSSEILSHLQKGTYTKPTEGDPSAEGNKNEGNKKRKSISSGELKEPSRDERRRKVARKDKKRKSISSGELKEPSGDERRRKFARKVKSGSPTEEELQDLSVPIISVWKALGRCLGISEGRLTAFHKQNEECSEKAYAMLLHWKQGDGSDATYRVLHDALCDKKVNQRALAEELCFP